MANRKRHWVYVGPKPVKPQVPDSVKTSLKEQADEIITNILKPKYINTPPTNNDFNYLVEIYSKWYRNYFYFCAKYDCPSPNAISPSFETKFARMEYIDHEQFNLSYMRHTGQWWEIYQALPMVECLKLIVEEPHFMVW